ncbi:MAG TPA: T9SS type A sorting domain-containing protein [Candidatus Cloacimonadota bacterium]|nr:T9SS type A sorting domain-containing protein [Candidatus Cloacimonadota bacterium]
MNRLFFVCSLCILSLMLYAQRENWQAHSYSGYYPDEICCVGSEIWVASDAGLMCWDTTHDVRTQYSKQNTPISIDWFLSVCEDDQGQIWAGGYGGLMRFDGECWHLFSVEDIGLSDIVVRRIVKDSAGTMWIATESGVASYSAGQWNAYTSANSTLPYTYDFIDFDADMNGGVWLCVPYQVYHFDGTQWFLLSQQPGLPTLPSINSIACDTNGGVWFLHDTGVMRNVGALWWNETAYQGYDLDGYTSIWADPFGGVWLTEWDNLLHIPNWGIVEHYSNDDIADYNLGFMSVEVDPEGRVWLSMFDTYSPQSLVCLEAGNATPYPVCAMPLPSPYVQKVFRGFDDKLWLATSEEKGTGGILSIDNEGGIECYGMYNIPMACDHVWSMAQDSQLNLWIGGCIQLLKWSPSGYEEYSASQTGIGGGWVKTICAVGDEVWIGNGSGVSRYCDGVWNPLTAAEAGMDPGNTEVIKVDGEGTVWLGCSNGLLYYQNGVFNVFSEIIGTSDIAFGPSGDVWVAHGELSHYANGVWTHYTPSDFPWDSSHFTAVAVDHSNVVWVATAHERNLHCFDGTQWCTFDATNSPLENVISVIYVDSDNTKWFGGIKLYLYNENGLPVSTVDPIVPAVSKALAYPNPFRSALSLRFEKLGSGPLELTVYNLKGQRVISRSYTSLAKGQQELVWDGKDGTGRDCASGIYLLSVRENGHSFIHKALKIK